MGRKENRGDKWHSQGKDGGVSINSMHLCNKESFSMPEHLRSCHKLPWWSRRGIFRRLLRLIQLLNKFSDVGLSKRWALWYQIQQTIVKPAWSHIEAGLGLSIPRDECGCQSWMKALRFCGRTCIWRIEPLVTQILYVLPYTSALIHLVMQILNPCLTNFVRYVPSLECPYKDEVCAIAVCRCVTEASHLICIIGNRSWAKRDLLYGYMTHIIVQVWDHICEPAAGI